MKLWRAAAPRTVFVKHLANGSFDPGFGRGRAATAGRVSTITPDQVRNPNLMADGDLIACVESGAVAPGS